MKINIIGGGPAGLYFGLLAKKRAPDAAVTVFERNPPDATYGFGVVLADQGLQHLKAADAESFRRIVAAMEMLDEQVLHLPSGSIVIDSLKQAGSISRLALLKILQDCCREAGVVMHFGQEIVDLAPFLDADLLVAADGVNSRVRSMYAEQFGTTIRHLNNRFAWFGVERGYDRPALAFREHKGGAFVGHYYRYTPEMSTFVVECDAATWFELGMHNMSDAARQALSEEVFAADLGGKPLIANHSMWRQFSVVQNQRWTFNNVVLLGDAQRSVHFSIGSGTRLAMEDAAALYTAFAEANCNVEATLRTFEAIRRPAVAILTDAARKSYSWYEGFAARMHAEPLDFAYEYMTRTGRMSDKRLHARHPKFMTAYEARQASTAGASRSSNGEAA